LNWAIIEFGNFAIKGTWLTPAAVCALTFIGPANIMARADIAAIARGFTERSSAMPISRLHNLSSFYFNVRSRATAAQEIS
jgi:hypothetical protein